MDLYPTQEINFVNKLGVKITTEVGANMTDEEIEKVKEAYDDVTAEAPEFSPSILSLAESLTPTHNKTGDY